MLNFVPLKLEYQKQVEKHRFIIQGQTLVIDKGK